MEEKGIKNQSTSKEKRDYEYLSQENTCKRIKSGLSQSKTRSQNKCASHWQPPLKTLTEKSGSLVEEGSYNEASSDVQFKVNQSCKIENENCTNNKEQSFFVDSCSLAEADCVIPEFNGNESSNEHTPVLENNDCNSQSPNINSYYTKEENIAGSDNISHISSLETLPFYSQDSNSSSSQYSIQEEGYVKEMIAQKALQFDRLNHIHESQEDINVAKADYSEALIPTATREDKNQYAFKSYNNKSLESTRETHFNHSKSQEIKLDQKNEKSCEEKDNKNYSECPAKMNEYGNIERCDNKYKSPFLINLEPNTVDGENQINGFDLSPQKIEMFAVSPKHEESITFSNIPIQEHAIMSKSISNRTEDCETENDLETTQHTDGVSRVTETPSVEAENVFKLPEIPKLSSANTDNIDDIFESELELSNSQLLQIEKQFSKPASNITCSKQGIQSGSQQLDRTVAREKQILQNIIKEVEALNELVLKLTKDLMSQMKQPLRK